MKERPQTGFLLVAGASICFGINPLLVKLLLTGGMPIERSLVYRFLLMGSISLIMAAKEGASFSINAKQARDIVIFGILGFGMTNLLLGSSYLYVDMGLATLCHFIYPVVVVCIMRLIFREKIDKYKASAIAMAIMGLMLLSAKCGSGSLKGMMIASLSGVTYGIYEISLSKASFREMNKSLCVFYVCMVCCVFYFIQSTLAGTFELGVTAREFCLMCASSTVGASGLVMFAAGVRKLGPTKASFVNMLEPVTNLIVDYLAYGAFPALSQAAGCIMILGAIGAASLSPKN